VNREGWNYNNNQPWSSNYNNIRRWERSKGNK
jgi:hypothetical protein